MQRTSHAAMEHSLFLPEEYVVMFALDIDPQMVRSVVEKSSELGLVNMRPLVRDLLRDGSGLMSGSVDYVMASTYSTWKTL